MLTDRCRGSFGRALMTAAVLLAQVVLVRADVDTQARALVRSTDLRQTQYSLFAREVLTSDDLMGVEADEALAPASNMKVLTSTAAIRFLGADFMFRTDLRLIDGEHGQTLAIIGDGDPSLGDPKLLEQHGMSVEDLIQSWVKAVRDAGVKKLDAILVDDRVFDDAFIHASWPTDQLHYWYCAEVAGLTFHDNCLDIYPRPTSSRLAPELRISPDVPFLRVSNRGVTGNSDSFWVSRDPGTNDLTFRGTVQNARVKPVSVTIHDPSMLLGRIIQDRLKRVGIEAGQVDRPKQDQTLAPGRLIHQIKTALPLVVARCNKDSQNLFAECLFKRMGRKVTGAPGSWENGAAALRMFLHEKLGARGASVVIADGSGMSRDNRVSARLMVDLLSAVWLDPKIQPTFLQSLSIGGEDGTLQLRLRKGLKGKVYGKSGYIDGVSALSGYLVLEPDDDDAATQPNSAASKPATRPTTRVVAFSFLFNGFKPPIYAGTLKQLQDKLVRLLDQEIASDR
ncbi:MAG: D-alanyl-D-alanine carboxypeptidase/D-alanyl-D-alanine-endopeptidase [Phycisphaeraceae bacterium]|nr:D-alanyl-D-alanine carboxypeptidase/D-alanyl-D-alanine-endopeptidase [Phycisphaeraceae bacterium]